MAQSFKENVINANELYYVAQKPLDFENLNNNNIEEGDYGYGVYLYPNKEEAIKAACFFTLKLGEQNNNDPIHVYKYTFNPIDIDYNLLQPESWMFKWFYNDNHPSITPYDKANWNCYAFLWKQYLKAHQNDNPKLYGYDCSLVCGPVVDANLILWLWGDDVYKAESHYQNLVALDPDKPIEFCFKSIFSLKKLGQCLPVENYNNWTELNNKIAELTH